MEYLAEFMARLDEQSRLRTAWENGEEKGIEKGKEDTARELKRLGIAQDIICQATGLLAEEVAVL